MQRDPIYAALLNQLLALTTNTNYQAQYGAVQVASRGFVPWDQADDQPAIYIVPMTENGVYKRGLPTKWMLKLDLYVYVRWIDSVEQGVTALAQVMDGIDYVLSPTGPNGGILSDNGYVNNLNGLAVYCALSGEAEISGGFLNKMQTIARMPMEIMVVA
jgi:hypothetical protein